MENSESSMNPDHRKIETLFAQLAAGRLDELTPQQISALEAAIHESPELADRLAAIAPPGDAGLQAPAATPSRAEWARTWNAIEESFASRPSAQPAPAGRIYTLGRAAAAVAACIGLVVLWRSLPFTPATSSGWELAASNDTEILELEVFDGRSATLHFADDDSGAVGISIGDPDDSDTGA
jgi:hypothetical protein